MKKLTKVGVGSALWVFDSYCFAWYAHIAPEGQYSGTGSSIEIISVMFMVASFILIPILVGAWITYPEE